jgi:hypothetical protein
MIHEIKFDKLQFIKLLNFSSGKKKPLVRKWKTSYTWKEYSLKTLI